MIRKDKIRVGHFVDLLNKINTKIDPSILNEQDNLRLQILLLHVYLDYLLILITEDISPPKSKNLKCLKRKNGSFKVYQHSGKLKLLRMRKVLDSNAYKVLKWLNDVRNIIAHEYDFNVKDVEKVILRMRLKIPQNLQSHFDNLNLTAKMSFACVLYINSLRDYIRVRKKWSGIDKIKVVGQEDRILFSVEESAL